MLFPPAIGLHFLQDRLQDQDLERIRRYRRTLLTDIATHELGYQCNDALYRVDIALLHWTNRIEQIIEDTLGLTTNDTF